MSAGEWEAIHGAGAPDGSVTWKYESGKYSVFYNADRSEITTASRIHSITRWWTVGAWPSLATMRSTARQLMPADARLVKTVRDPDSYSDLVVDIFSSASLARRFPADFVYWYDSSPGTFTAFYGAGNVTLELSDMAANAMVPGSGSNPRIPTPIPSGSSSGSGGSSGGSSGGGRIGAICRDGWRSSATGSGACSHHGGVAQWLYGP